jgi:catechol 2,3-dioxygenase
VIRNNRAESRREVFKVDTAMQVQSVTLNVSSLAQSIDFYQSILGFITMGRSSSDRAFLSAVGNPMHLMELRQTVSEESRERKSGLYHLAILLPERKFLADMLQNLRLNQDRVRFDGLADHLVSESIYIRDPDLNGIELYADRPRETWHWDGERIQISTLPLNTDDLIRESTDHGWKQMPGGTRIGHVHLHVRDLAKAVEFYHEFLGLNLTASISGAAFFAAGSYHHHVAANTWLGPDISSASPEDRGLNHFTLELSGKGEFGRLLEQLSEYGQTLNESSDNSFFIKDMDGIRIRFQHR